MSQHSGIRYFPSRAEQSLRILAVAVIGGDGRRSTPHFSAVTIRSFPSSKYGGNGRHQSALAAIRDGSFDLVLLLIRWLGHSDTRSIVTACRAGRVRVHLVAGGMTAATRALREYVGQEVRCAR